MTALSPRPSLRPGASTSPIRVLIADDSAVVRGLVARWLEAEPGVIVAGMARDGREAVDLAGKLKPDVIVLDVEMPELDGLQALPLLIAAAPKAKILVSSSLTRRNAEVTLKALQLGATDCLAKPETGRLGGADAFRTDLIARVKVLGGRPSPAPAAPASSAAAVAVTPSAVRAAPTLRAAGARPPAQVIVVGCSTGGPNALQVFLPALAGRTNAPILLVQHMPPMFTAVLAEHLAKRLGGRASEAVDGELLKPGYVYVAPGDRHMRVERKAGVVRIALDSSPPVNFCRPAVDPLFISAAEVFGAAVVGCVLTGMGADGRTGAEAIVGRGGVVLAQDEATSVVWGMPGAVAQAGLATAVKPLNEIGPAVLAMAQGTSR